MIYRHASGVRLVAGTVSAWVRPICSGVRELNIQTNSGCPIWPQGKKTGHTTVKFINATKITDTRPPQI